MTVSIKSIAKCITNKRILITDHADEEARNDVILLSDLIGSILEGEILEQYPSDLPFPSCLIFSKLKDGSPTHSVWAYSTGTEAAVLITGLPP